MKRVSPAPPLLLLGGVLMAVGLPLRWSAVTTTDGTRSVSSTGLDYAGYDIATTVAFAALIVVAAFVVATGWRWGQVLAVGIALLACMWAALVYLAAGYPADGGSSAGVTVSVGSGTYVLAAGAFLSLIGAVLSFRGRGVAAVPSGVQPSV
jgi:uncharacterized membrane-anchored protein YitT (DUF2179 family)